MASATGTDGIVKLVTDGGSLATVAEVRSFTIDETADTIESTSMGDSART
jgi:predicted secreted protein